MQSKWNPPLQNDGKQIALLAESVLTFGNRTNPWLFSRVTVSDYRGSIEDQARLFRCHILDWVGTNFQLC